jgi:hypothetical protein
MGRSIAYKGLLIIDSIGTRGSTPAPLVSALLDCAEQMKLKIVVLTDINPIDMKKTFYQGKILPAQQPEIVQKSIETSVRGICAEQAQLHGVSSEHCIYFSDRLFLPETDISRLEEARQTGASVLVRAGFGQRNQPLCAFYNGPDCGEHPFTLKLSTSYMLEFITEKWRGAPREAILERIRDRIYSLPANCLRN